jgi:hypothetical protein
VVSALWPSLRGAEFSVVVTHVVFGLITAGAYRGLLKRKPEVPVAGLPESKSGQWYAQRAEIRFAKVLEAVGRPEVVSLSGIRLSWERSAEPGHDDQGGISVIPRPSALSVSKTWSESFSTDARECSAISDCLLFLPWWR